MLSEYSTTLQPRKEYQMQMLLPSAVDNLERLCRGVGAVEFLLDHKRVEMVPKCTANFKDIIYRGIISSQLRQTIIIIIKIMGR